MRNLNKEAVIRSVIVLFLLQGVILIFAGIVFGKSIISTSSRTNNLENRLQQSEDTQKELLENMRIIRQQQEELNRINQERVEAEQRRARSISNIQSRGFNRYSDISANKYLTPEDMDKIIDAWNSHIKDGTRFKGHGAAFIEASKRSGLNPIIILAHAAEESNWGNSRIAIEKNNFFGINCVDSNPNDGYDMGDNIDEGIINGAIWISKNFYSNGYTSLQSMLDANYASNGSWAGNIVNIANVSARLLQI
jgi:beta-N-acetylglucosaminidase